MIDYITAALFGGLGGVVRALVGFGKAMKNKKKFNLVYFLLTSFIGIVVGVIVGMMLNYDWRISFVSGYAGTDVLEGLSKMFKDGKAYGLIVK